MSDIVTSSDAVVITPPKWEEVDCTAKQNQNGEVTERLWIEEGWLYRVTTFGGDQGDAGIALTFVPSAHDGNKFSVHDVINELFHYLMRQP